MQLDPTNTYTDVEISVAYFNSGGGFSREFAMPSYQATYVKQYLSSGNTPPASTFNSSNRGFPDLSALGDKILTVVNVRCVQRTE